ncbi:MAG: hypothetical protein L0228_04405 [Planctomycetes bacterium]|nr:hypothetical protein [Planctomycetota bacterium]
MHWQLVQLVAAILVTATALAITGCGTTRSTDTNRTATEQLLVSDAIDRAVQSVDVNILSGQSVFLDDSRLGEVVDRNYLISTLRQHLLANGCQLRDQRDQADFIVEARAGAVGTDRNDLLFGVPSTNVPQILPVQPVPAAVIPEIPIAKRRDQKGIAKLAVFAYHRETGTPVWQSGLVHQESSANDVWILGAGPFQRGSIYDGTAFAGKKLGNDEVQQDGAVPRRLPAVDLTRKSTFTPPRRLAKAPPPATTPPEQPVVQATHQDSQPPADAAATAPSQPAAATPSVAESLPVSSTAQPPVTVAQPEAAKAEPPQPPAAQSVYTPAGTTPLPQPRFNSP